MGNEYLVDIVQYLLRAKKVKAPRKEICVSLYSDPSFPSLAAISQTLAYFGFKNDAFAADIDHLKKLSNILVHSKENDGHFYVLKEIKNNTAVLYDGNYKTVSIQRFTGIWDGILLTLGSKTSAPVYSGKDQLQIRFNYFVLSIILLYGFFMLSGISAVQFLIDTIGLFISYLLFLRHNSIYSKLLFCHIGEKVDCNAVADKNPIKQYLSFDLSILGMFFFLFDSINLCILNQEDLFLEFVYVIATLLMIFLSYYQLFIIKTYCLYCLLMTLLVALKLVLLWCNEISNNFDLNPEYGIIAAIVYLLCVLFYRRTIDNRNFIHEKIALLRIKRKPQSIKSFFPVKHNAYAMNGVLEFGNKDASIIITSFVSLNCRHCKAAIKESSNLINKFPGTFLWRVVIDGAYHSSMSNDEFASRNSKQLYLRTIYEQDKKLCFRKLRSWKFKDNLGYDEDKILKYRDELEHLSHLGLAHYPTIWINNRVLPTEYSISDLQYIQQDLEQLK